MYTSSKNKKQTLKTFFIFSSIIFVLISCNNESYNETEGYYFENCRKIDTLTYPNEQLFEDSMIKSGYDRFEIDHLHEHASNSTDCANFKNYHQRSFLVSYWRKNAYKEPQYAKDSCSSNKIRIIKVLFTNCLSDSTIMSYNFFNIRDIDYDDPINSNYSREDIFEICGFKIVPISKMKWKRVLLK